MEGGSRMIDTDKYTGHAKEGWHFDSAHVLRDGYDKEIAELVGEDWLDDKATQELIADAPLLLEEVKRLRKELNQTRECLWWCYDKERFGWEVDEEQWEIIGRLLGADTDHNDNEWEGEEE